MTSLSSLPPITVPAQYSSITPTAAAAAGVISLLGGVQINLSGSSQGGLSAAFSLGGWVRASASFVATLTTQDASADADSGFYPVFTNDQFSLGWTGDGLLVAGFGSTPSAGDETCVSSAVSAADGFWHFVAVTYAPSAQGGGTLGLMVDGTWLDPATVTSADLSNANPGALTLCPAVDLGGDQLVDLASWWMWNVALDESSLEVPIWGSPPAGDPLAAGLALGLNFASGPDIEATALGATVSVGAQNWNTPCIQLSNLATLPAEDGVNPGGAAGSFSVATWFGLDPQTGGTSQCLLYNDLVNPLQSGVHNNLMVAVVYTNPSCYLFIQFTDGANANNGFLFSTPAFEVDAWTHLAVTYDASISCFQVYRNGVPLADGNFTAPATSGFADGTASYGVSLGPSSSDILYLQGLSYWSKALTPGEILNANDRVDPTGTNGLSAYFSFMAPAPGGMTNSADGHGEVLSIMQGGTALITQTQAPVATQGSAAIPSRRMPILASQGGAARNEPCLLGRDDYRRLAREHAIDVEAPPEPADPDAAQSIQGLMDFYEGLLKDAKPRLARHLRTRFRRNLLLGMAVQAKSPGAGRYAWTTNEGVRMLTYGTRHGPVVVPQPGGIVEAVDEDLLRMCLTVGSDVIGILLSLFGLKVPARAMVRALKKMGSAGLQNVCKAMAAAAATQTSKLKSAGAVIMAYLSYLQTAGDFSLFCWSLLSELSWWDLAFTVFSLFAMFVGILASGGLALALKLADLAVNVAQLIADIASLVSYLTQGAVASATESEAPRVAP